MEALGVHTEDIYIVLAIGISVFSFYMFEGLEQMFNGLLISTNLKIIALCFCENHPPELLMHRSVPVI